MIAKKTVFVAAALLGTAISTTACGNDAGTRPTFKELCGYEVPDRGVTMYLKDSSREVIVRTPRGEFRTEDGLPHVVVHIPHLAERYVYVACTNLTERLDDTPTD